MAHAEPHSEEVEAALSRLLAWPEIARSPQLAAFLTYIVRRTLAGEASAIKAYAIAVDVLGRPPTFDPQSDPIVRVQARRLRMLLEQYYSDGGSDERIRIRLPTGRYVPDFVTDDLEVPPLALPVDRNPPSMAPAHKNGHSRTMLVWFAAIFLVAGALVMGYLALRTGPPDVMRQEHVAQFDRPEVIVDSFANLTGDPAAVSLSAGLALELVTDLEQFDTLVASYGDGRSLEGGVSVDADFVLSGIVRRTDQDVVYSVLLTDAAQGDVVWTRTVTLSRAEASRPDVLDAVSGILSRELGSFRGPLHKRARVQIERGEGVAGPGTPYWCRMLFEFFRTTNAREAAERADRCYAGLQSGQDEPGVLAAQASLASETWARSGALVSSDDALLMRANELMDRAQAGAPTNAFVWGQRARLEEIEGRHEAAEAAYSAALQLNPADLDIIAARARHLAFTGQATAGAVLARTAIGGAPMPPAWYVAALAVERLLAGDYHGARGDTLAYAMADQEIGPVLVVVAAEGTGDSAMAGRYLAQVMEVPSFRAHGIMTQLRWRITDPLLLGAIRESLLQAGVSVDVLDASF